MKKRFVKNIFNFGGGALAVVGGACIGAAVAAYVTSTTAKIVIGGVVYLTVGATVLTISQELGDKAISK